MASKYDKWIRFFYPTARSAKDQAEEAAYAMVEHFPELKVQKGFLRDLYGIISLHWWCVDKQGFIFDPTAHQYPGPRYEYRNFPENAAYLLGDGNTLEDLGSYLFRNYSGTGTAE